jgi:curli biogenesis system outer membrane secretion channel CsgG
MKRGMKTLIMTGVAATLALLAQGARADDPRPTLKQLGVEDVAATKALKTTVAKSGQGDKLDRLTDSLNQHFLVAFKGTRKFDVIARSDLALILKEQQIPTGVIIDAADRKALPGKIKGLDYLLVAALSDFSDAKDGVTVEGQGIVVSRRTVQATMILKIYDATTAALLEAVDVPVQRQSKGTQRVVREGFNNGAVDDALIEEAAVELANKAATRVVDVVYPARVMSVTDGVVTINRGETTGIAPNQVWEAFATGKELIDPDTGQSLGKEEIKVGEIVITDVLPKFSKGRVVGENRGIDGQGTIVRRRLNLPDPDGLPPRQPR